MAALGIKRFAVDANFVLDLAGNEDFAWSLLKALCNKGYSFELPPTAVIELNLISHTYGHPSNKLAQNALQNLLSWSIRPFDLKNVGHGITDLFAKTLISRGLLPDDEFNDGVILAETSLANIPHLLTSDRHLIGIDATSLQLVFEARDLPPVTVIHVRKLARALKEFGANDPD